MIKACFFNDTYVAPKKALIKINDLGLLRGYGVFDFCRAVNGKPFLLNDYLQRFRRSASFLNLDLDLPDFELIEIVNELCKSTKEKEFGIRFLLTGGYTEDGYSVSKPNLILFTENYNAPSDLIGQSGVKLMSHEFLRELPEAKTTNYLTAIRLQKKKAEENAFDILYHFNGKILELTRSNFFMIKGGRIITPEQNILKGITRKTVIELAREKFIVEERDILWAEIFEAEEAFLTSTGRKIVPVAQIDAIKIGKGAGFSITEELIKKFKDFESRFMD